MALFQRLLWAALAAALLVGSVQTGVHQRWAVPIILAAETFEDQKAEPAAAAPVPEAAQPGHSAHAAHAPAQAAAAAADAPAPEPWSPSDGAERTFWTWVANVLHALSMALLVLAVMGVWVWQRGAARSPLRLAAAVAAAGWLSLYQWPALGLPAEIPGMDAARLGSRQGWWLMAAGSAAAACAVLAFGRRAWRFTLAAVLLAAPFVWGAPHITADPLAGFSGEAHRQLQALDARFLQATAWIAATFWACMALACAVVFGRWIQPPLVAALDTGLPTGPAAAGSTP
ncbi:CbtA family protein [Paracidovorax wautersii]|uniref:Cobalt transporter subunit CbtA n=1 Tax=Paracidovorax wautersii TaxID=1177982 RepID=A0ABU1I8K6_9BURK|nr:CbtA family protein [Paracidovorax wautersii]MDR6213554.1 cobalt transporter subunit CbtA [Paracidovorax wautersii]